MASGRIEFARSDLVGVPKGSFGAPGKTSGRRLHQILLALLVIYFHLLHPLSAATQNYSVDTSTDFSNPERGWYPTMYYYGPGSHSNEMVTSSNFQNDISNSSNYANDTNITLIKRIYDFGGLNGATSYQNTTLPSQVLTDMTSDFSNARSMGVKLILRFDYNEGPIGANDASQSTILSQISQIAPLLQANDDVIAYMEAGFIGTWGEWHDSSNGLTDVNNNNSTGAEATILDAVLAALPTDRMVAVRYPGYTLEIFGTTSPISAANAFNGSNYSRCGTHDDCFESTVDDSGTYSKGTALLWSVGQFKNYLNLQNYSVSEGGESCATSGFSGCSNSLADLQSEHWSALHCQYEQGVIQGWATGGCIDAIDLGLGYRYELLNANLPSNINQGGSLQFSFQVYNAGFANCYNPRGMALVLRPSGSSGTGTLLNINPNNSNGTDPRFWTPGTTSTASVSLTVPNGLSPGAYDALLFLPDPKTSLNSSPAYAIRLADLGTWEAGTGYNKLNLSLNVSGCGNCNSKPNVSQVTLVPNPSQGAATQGVSYQLSAAASQINIQLYGSGMRLIQSFTDGAKGTGWQSSTFSPPQLADGTYFLKISADSPYGTGHASVGIWEVLR